MMKMLSCFLFIVFGVFSSVYAHDYECEEEDVNLCVVCSKDVGRLYIESDFKGGASSWTRGDNSYKGRLKYYEGEIVAIAISYPFCNDCYEKYSEQYIKAMEIASQEYINILIKENLEIRKANQKPRDAKRLKSLKSDLESINKEISEIEDRLK